MHTVSKFGEVMDVLINLTLIIISQCVYIYVCVCVCVCVYKIITVCILNHIVQPNYQQVLFIKKNSIKLDK